MGREKLEKGGFWGKGRDDCPCELLEMSSMGPAGDASLGVLSVEIVLTLRVGRSECR